MRNVLPVLIVVAILLVPATPVYAESPLDVHFDVETSWPDENMITSGPFEVKGSAVDEGLICPFGDTIDIFERGTGKPGKRVNVHMYKLFTCEDGSGSFIVHLQVKIDWVPEFTDVANWQIVGGTGDYEKLHGSGKLEGFHHPQEHPYMVDDVYDGQVHND